MERASLIRGALHKAVLPGDYGKPRPVLIVQSVESDIFESMVVCPLTSDVSTAGPLRVTVEPTEQNGLKTSSLIMVEKVGGLAKTRIREQIGSVDTRVMSMVEDRLLILLGLVH